MNNMILRIVENKPKSCETGTIGELCIFLLQMGYKSAATDMAKLVEYEAGEFISLSEDWFFLPSESVYLS